MPRRKVPLADRKRALVACRLCKTHKKRCDGKVPCSNCARRGCGETCSYPDDVAGWGGTPAQSDNRDATRAPSDVNSPATAPPAVSSAPPHKTSHRMLCNAQGEKVYIGRSASIAFLQLVRDTVTRQIGATDFSQHAARDHMLEAKRTGYEDLHVPVIVEAGQRQEYINLYSIATSGILHVFPQDEMYYMTCIEDETSRPYHFATGRLVLAIGAQCSARLPVHRKNELQLFERGREAAMSGMLEDPCVEFVAVFLLMSFYMLGACQRNAAFMYLGIAVRAAYVLGFHNTESYGQLAEVEGQRRAAIWQSLVTLDEMISSILDRPSAISIQHTREGPPDRVFKSINSSTGPAFGAAFRLSKIVAEIGEKLQEKKTTSLVSAERQLQELRKWTQELPESLKNHVEGEYQSIEAQKGVVGSLHVTCYYYFAVILVSRPFLVAHLSERHATTVGSSSQAAPHKGTKGELRVADMAYACLRAAISLSQTCTDVAKSAGLFENLRLLTAWTFAGGLVIGFQMFAVPTLDLELEEAYHGIHGIMNALARHTPQASQYYDILSSLFNAVQQRRQSLGSKTKRPSDLVTDRIMNFHSNTINQEQVPIMADQMNLFAETTGQQDSMEYSDDEIRRIQLEMDDSIWSWENAVSQIWDHSLGDPFSVIE